jgi:protein O-GlcNAc transferase
MPPLLRQALEHHQAGRLDQAEQLYRQLLQSEPHNADACNLLGMLARQREQFPQAIELIGRAIALRPSVAAYHFNLGEAQRAHGQLEEALASYRTALSLTPNDAEMHHAMAQALDGLHRLKEAANAYRQAVQHRPQLTQAWLDLGKCCLRIGRLDEAVAALERVRQTRPQDGDVHVLLGKTLLDRGRASDAVPVLRRAVQLCPNSAEGHSTLAAALGRSGQAEAAATAGRRAVELDPKLANTYANLGAILHQERRLDDSIACFREGLKHCPNAAKLHSSLLFVLNYHPQTTAQRLYQEAENWWNSFGRPLADQIKPHANSLDPDRRPRIGYVSPSFCQHAMASFIEPILANHDHQRFEIFCYSDATRSDQTNQRLRKCADAWRDTFGQRDSEVAELIRGDGIDILVDLSGHTGNNRLRLFARKPAPLQVSYLEYPPTTGLETIDYKITDAIADPPGAEQFYREKLYRLPGGAWCYQPPEESPEPNALPTLKAGHVTFGCLNNPPKVTDAMLVLWAQILRQAPGSRLLLLHSGDAADGKHIRQRFGEYHIADERLELLTKRPRQQYLQLYQRIDIALDPSPYNGHTTTCDCLWMGVPVITLSGERHVSRVGRSILSTLDLAELIANTPEQYVQIALRLASNLPALQALRGGLRPRLRQSLLTGAAAFTRNLETAYRDIWRQRCRES